MDMFMAIYCAILFFVLSPGVLFRLPKNGSKFVVAGVHAVIFGVVSFFTCKLVWNFSQTLLSPSAKKEGLIERNARKKEPMDVAQTTRPQLAQ